MPKIKILRVDGNDLYQRNAAKTDLLPVYVLLDPKSGKLTAEVSTLTQDKFRGHLLRWRIRPLEADAANDLLFNLAEAAQIVCNGHWTEPTDYISLDRYTTEACEAMDEIERICNEVFAAEDSRRSAS